MMLSAIFPLACSLSCAAGNGDDTHPVVPHPDAAGDAAQDVPIDAAGDPSAEPSFDAYEAAWDGEQDASAEPPPDAQPEAAADVPSDVAFDVHSEESADAPVDAAIDVPGDVAQEPPPDVVDALGDVNQGPVDPGVYSYTIVPSYALINPPAAAWHPSSDYALVLNATNQVYRYDRVANTLTQVAATAATLSWRAVQFTPDGSKAVLLGNDTTAKEGRIYLWDHATSQLSQMTAETFAGGTYEALAFRGTTAKLLGAKSNPYIAYVWTLDPAAGRSDVKAANSAAGCQDLAWATDQFDAPAVAIVCGVNGVDLMHLNGGGQFVHATGNAGNTSRISGRPQGDYALAICNSCNSKVYRFQQGLWQTPYGSPTVQGGYSIRFSADGARALVLGSYFNTKGRAYEFRHDLMAQNEIYDVSIPNMDAAPYNADTYVQLNDAAWRPECHGGIIVGGSNTYSSQKGYLIRFSADNGVPCP